MPLYRGTVKKHLIATGHQWSNVYTFNGFDVDNALSACITAAALEKSVTFDLVQFETAKVVQIGLTSDQKTESVAGPGSLHHDTVGVQLPLFCCFRVVFVDAIGHPEMKYLRRPGFSDELTADGEWSNTFLAEIQSLYVDDLVAMAEFVGPSGEQPVSGFVSPVVQNRQLSWSRRFRPGFHRGWVPD